MFWIKGIFGWWLVTESSSDGRKICNAGDMGQILGLRKTPGKETTHSSPGKFMSCIIPCRVQKGEWTETPGYFTFYKNPKPTAQRVSNIMHLPCVNRC